MSQQQLKAWLSAIDRVEEKLAQVPDFRQYGKLTRATGLVMEAVGLKLPIGALCIVERQTDAGIVPVESEVVGFSGQTLYLMPLEHVDGILPGARIYACRATATAASSCPSARTCWAACWTRRGARWMDVPRRVNPLPASLLPRLTRCTATR